MCFLQTSTCFLPYPWNPKFLRTPRTFPSLRLLAAQPHPPHASGGTHIVAPADLVVTTSLDEQIRATLRVWPRNRARESTETPSNTTGQLPSIPRTYGRERSFQLAWRSPHIATPAPPPPTTRPYTISKPSRGSEEAFVSNVRVRSSL